MSAARPRLSEVAALAGVSEKTVSNVLNNYPHITPRTRSKVEEALKALHYRVNLSARSLASGRTGFIALAVPGLDNPYFAHLAHQVIGAAAAHQWTVLIEQTAGASSNESEVIGGAIPYLVDGIILHPESLDSGDLIERDDSTPLVLIGEKALDQVADHVAADNVTAARRLTQHLLDTRRRRIAVVGIGPQSKLRTSTLRFEGFAAALRASDLAPDPALIFPVETYDRRTGADVGAAVAALPQLPDAVICFNDVLAVGVLHGLTEAGVDVPGDVALAGFDAIDETGFTAPPITSVAWDTGAIATEAIALLAARQADPDRAQQEVGVGFELMVRASTGPRVMSPVARLTDLR
jgi:LacI family repressor for deo operon, udp, cdd, tsx, nupC, and nupG